MFVFRERRASRPSDPLPLHASVRALRCTARRPQQALQFLQYFVLDDCGHWLNKWTTILSFVHVCFQVSQCGQLNCRSSALAPGARALAQGPPVALSHGLAA